MSFEKFSPTESERLKLAKFFLENGPATINEIIDHFGWYREKANAYVRLLDCNVVGFRHTTTQNIGYARPNPLYAFSGKHIGGYCLTCGRKLALVPKDKLRGSLNSVRRVREQDCRSCRAINRYETKERKKDELTGEVSYEPPDPTSVPRPTTARPGSEAKIRVLARRYANGLLLWHPADKPH